VSSEKPDVILTRYNLYNFSAAAVARMRRIPFVVEVNSPMAHENRKFNTGKLHLPVLPEWIERLNLRMASAVVVVSEVLRDYFVRQGIPESKISVVPNGVDPEVFSPEIPSTGVREKYNLQGKVVIGFVGSFHYWHGVDNLLGFMAEVLRGYDHVRFLLVGTGPLHQELESAVRDQGYSDRVSLTGYVPHEKVPEYISAMDIVLAPYPAMDFFYFSPLKLFEYMACGKPVVASRLGQIAELIKDGVNGMLYEPEDLPQMAVKCRVLIENPELRSEIGRNARKSILAGYTWRSNAEKIIEVLKLATNGRS
jgi:glycosyltransferase involved in cell wall biosynthesis